MNDWDESTLRICFNVRQNQEFNIVRNFHFALGSKDLGHASFLDEGTNSCTNWASSVTLAQNWLSQCMENHNKCQQIRLDERSRFTPTRLLEIAQPTSQKVRLLVHPYQNDSTIQYATLSHCWGTSKVLRLTSKSFPYFKEGMEISELAQKFQDAIFTARSLGIRFLWIDSFCILQDSLDDWRQESALMHEVYMNSTVSIAASAAVDSNAGCFPAKNPSELEPYFLETAWSDRENKVYHLYKIFDWDATLQEMPLVKRGWVVQETILAPRVLHLGGRQLYWECYESYKCETYPNGIPPQTAPHFRLDDTTRDNTWYAFVKIRNRIDAANNGSTDPKTDLKHRKKHPQRRGNRLRHRNNRLLDTWYGIVKNYSQCGLTYTTDKLIALSGIAKLMEEILEDEYCSGLWKSRLIIDLSWWSEDSAEKPRPSAYRAPSWSWASSDGRITPSFYDLPCEALIEVINCKIKPVTDDHTGAVEEGCLRISGWLATIQIQVEGKRTWKIFFDGKWWNQRSPDLFIHLDCLLSSPQVHCLPLFLVVPHYEIDLLACLLLRPTGNQRGQFQRVGLMQLWTSGALGLDSYKSFESHPNLNWALYEKQKKKDWKSFPLVKNEPWLECERVDDNGKYVVSII